MIATLAAAVSALGSTIAFWMLLVMPGFAIAQRLLRGMDSRAAVLAGSVIVSVLILAVTTGTLLVIGAFSGWAVALVALVLAVGSVPAIVPWVRRHGYRSAVPLVIVAIATIPWVQSLIRPGFPPAETLQWYYWNLGSVLSTTGSAPATVAEYGLNIRWLPDYVFFNGVSEGFRALLWFLEPAQVAMIWRVPVAALSIVSIYLVARLWLTRPSAIVATLATATSLFFVNKFNAYKPEALGIVVALLAAWLIIRGLRTGHVASLALGGLGIGAAMGIHAIGATVIGLLLAAACVAELTLGSRPRRWTALAIVATAIVAIAVVIGTGIALQGRPLVIGDAFRPSIAEAGDPTWLYLQYSYGNFEASRPPPLLEHLATGIRRPWAGVDLTSLGDMWFFWLGGLGALFAWMFGDSRVKRGVATGLLGAALLAMGMAYFAIAFDTYVPQHTGLVRFGQYVPLLAAFVVGLSVEGFGLAWQRVSGQGVPTPVTGVAIVAALIVGVPAVNADYSRDAGIEQPGLDALAALRSLGKPGDVVLTNAATTGTIEMFTGLEAPLEGRQPLIEEPAILDQANRQLLAAHRLFGLERDPTIVIELGVRWLLVVDRAATLAAPGSFGGTVASAASLPFVVERWRGERVAVLEVVGFDPVTTPGPVRRDDRQPIGWLVTVALVVTLTVLLARIVSRFDDSSPASRERHAHPRRRRRYTHS